ncbi:hypothetical protein ED312_00320 [Sinomicrobium pectinilyticum]|uniref:Uncharacterized protein n=1 Tax=Sinomicrobium pectinilyticum TaxID=1084421 RepID=A0A3N0F4U7_SINP1|nr:hypothetical protein [Sinomicrobium pectinilyticum]RNL95085.1 hypothetical protein ED312_00320 [Sinomicrobium pectinilyticum]
MKNSLFILAFLICFKPLFPVLEYAANYDYIANVLCINKERPKIQCYGKCYLMGAIAKEVADGNDEKGTEAPKKTELPLLYIERGSPLPAIRNNPDYHPGNPFAPRDTIYFFLPVNRPLKPPIALS